MNKIHKISLIFSLLSLISSISIIGAGFSIWVFGEGESSTSLDDIEINVTNAYQFGEVNIYAPDTYYLEPNSDDLATYGGLVFYTKNSDLINNEGKDYYTLGSSVGVSIKSGINGYEIGDATIKNIEEKLICKLTISFTSGSVLEQCFNIIDNSHEYHFKYDKTYSGIDFVSTDAFNLNGNFEYKTSLPSEIDRNNNGIIDPNEWKIQTNKGSVILDFEFSGL